MSQQGILLSTWEHLKDVGQVWGAKLISSNTGFQVFCALNGSLEDTLVVTSSVPPLKFSQFDAVGISSVPLVATENWQLQFELKQAEFVEEFAALCASMVDSVSPAESAEVAMSSIHEAYESWFAFYRKSKTFSLDAARGLFAELQYFEEKLASGMKPSDVIEAWQGPKFGPHDFVFENANATEIKSIRPSNSLVRISSELQLEFAGELWLVIYRVQDHESPNFGETLQSVVKRLSSYFQAPERRAFMSLLEGVGYEDDLNVVREVFFEVQEKLVFDAGAKGFPKITPSQLSPGLSKVEYSVALSAANPFLVKAH